MSTKSISWDQLLSFQILKKSTFWILLAKVPQIPQVPILNEEIPSRDLWDLWDGRDLWDVPCPTLIFTPHALFLRVDYRQEKELLKCRSSYSQLASPCSTFCVENSRVKPPLFVWSVLSYGGNEMRKPRLAWFLKGTYLYYCPSKRLRADEQRRARA